MLIYITGVEYQKVIERAMYDIQLEHTISVGEPIKKASVNLLQEVKATLSKNKDISTLLIDLSVVSDEEDEIIRAIETLRFYNDKCRFIILATERFVGDSLLSRLVDMGIYNIIINEDEVLGKIVEYALTNATYKEASIFQKKEEKEEAPKRNRTKKEKILKQKKKKSNEQLNNKIVYKTIKNKVVIGVVGNMKRIGTTHTSIALSYSLAKQGYKVALIEYNNNNDLRALNNCYENNIYKNDFSTFTRIKNIDIFDNVTKDMFAKIHSLNYDYLVLDMGDINNADLLEYARADVRLMMFGSKAWEQSFLQNVVELIGDTNNLVFLTLCDSKMQDEINESLSPSLVVYPSFAPEPFTEDNNLMKALKGYVDEYIPKEKKGFLSKLLK